MVSLQIVGIYKPKFEISARKNPESTSALSKYLFNYFQYLLEISSANL